MMTFMVAGHETTSNALSWAFYCLSQHSAVEAKLRAEVVRCLIGVAPNEHSSTPTPLCVAADVIACPFCCYCFCMCPALCAGTGQAVYVGAACGAALPECGL